MIIELYQKIVKYLGEIIKQKLLELMNAATTEKESPVAW